MKLFQLLITIIITTHLNIGWAEDTTESRYQQLQKQWAINNYQLSGDEQLNAFEELIDETDRQIKDHPNEVSLYIWSGIIKSTYAGVKGGLGALKLAKAAKKDLEKAISIDGSALNGSAYTSLGSLYFNVPGWPIGFGDDEKAEKLLKQALEINPDGIDSNYFYADYLQNEKRYNEAHTYFQKALMAPARAGREIADKGRRNEVQAALLALEKHLH
jgi:tetratricopeptide (TPR) repeat protein